MAIYRLRNASYCFKLLLLRKSSLKAISWHSAAADLHSLLAVSPSLANTLQASFENKLGKQMIIVPPWYIGKWKLKNYIRMQYNTKTFITI